MHELEQTLFMPSTDVDPTSISDVYSYEDLSNPYSSALDWELPRFMFDETVDTMFDPATDGTWEPMNISGPSIDPALLAMSDHSLDTTSSVEPTDYAFTDNNVISPSQSLNYFDPTSYAPFSPGAPAPESTYPVSPLLEANSNTITSAPRTVTNSHPQPESDNLIPREPNPAIKLPVSRPQKIYQAPVDGSGCWCDLCTGPAPKVNAFDLAILTKPEKEKKAIRKQYQASWRADNRLRVLIPAPAKRGRPLKRKPREVTPEESEESESESESTSDDEDGDYRPVKKVKVEAAKRRKLARQEVLKGKKMLRGLQIDMNGWMSSTLYTGNDNEICWPQELLSLNTL
ncbi:MAG: hypothetical protein Q9213_000648 [Squamulea squamosa]